MQRMPAPRHYRGVSGLTCGASLVVILATIVLVIGTLAPGEDAPSPTPTDPASLSFTPPGGMVASPDLSATRTELLPPATAPSGQDRANYALQVGFDATRNRASVVEGVMFVNESPDDLASLVLVVDANRRQGVFHLERLAWGDLVPVDNFDFSGTTLEVPLDPPLGPGQSVTLRIEYDLTIPRGQGKLDAGRQTNVSDWYPFVPAYLSGTGWLVHPPSAVGEYLVYPVADYAVTITLSPDPAPGLVLAASAPCSREGPTFTCLASTVRNFTWSISPIYLLTVATIDNVTVQAYVFPEHTELSIPLLQTTTSALRTYGRLFGPYGHPQLTIVEGEFADGLEYDGLYYLGEEYFDDYTGDPMSYLVALAAHETAHQWWSAKVGSDPAYNPWLDEALATYSELLFYERVYPEITDRWWDFRVRRYDPQGQVGGSVYDFPGFRSYVNAVYLRGAEFLGEVASRCGESAVVSALVGYERAYAAKVGDPARLLDMLAGSCDESLDDLVSSYFGPA